MKLDKKIAFVTGGGSGIGRETCKLFAQEGAYVIVADRDLNSAKKVAEEVKKMAGRPKPLVWM